MTSAICRIRTIQLLSGRLQQISLTSASEAAGVYSQQPCRLISRTLRQASLSPTRFFSDKKGDNDNRDSAKDKRADWIVDELPEGDDITASTSSRPGLLSLKTKEDDSAVPALAKPFEDESDLWGLKYDDNKVGALGPDLPPKYKRDAVTGRFTGEIEKELSEEEKKLIKADPLERDRILVRRVQEHWKKSGPDHTLGGLPKELNELGKRVRKSDAALNVLGRSAQAQAAEEELDDGSKIGVDKAGFSQQLTVKEFAVFKEYMKKEHDMHVSDQDIPVQKKRITPKLPISKEDDPDELTRSLKWLTRRGQREIDDDLEDFPYADIMPADLSPSRIVNRKKAKLLPVNQLSHLNIPLLKSFMSPQGQILHRVQTRLGARDQRRVKRLIKRARCMGLIPYYGQFKAERHGWKHAPDIQEEREWEKELARRGLVIKRSNDATQNE